jgi:type I restriction enzyme S subunit
MIGEGKTRGQAAILRISASNSQNSAAIRVSEAGLPPEYLYYFFEKEYENIRKISSGNNQPALNKARVQNIVIPLAPAQEQVQTVAEIESRLSVCSEIQKAVEKGIRQSETLRQSILNGAFQGSLVPQDPTDEPAEKLLERIRAEKAKREADAKARNTKTTRKAKRKSK